MTNGTSSNVTGRIASIDVLRGIIMVLMAVDHVRVYAGVPARGPDPAVFFTRWITNFCAPGFVFFAGVGIYLHGRRMNDARALSRYLVTRGLFLVFLELTVVRFSWTFNMDYKNFMMAGVIWMIGWCMVLMALLVRLPIKWIVAIGVVMIIGHNVMDFFSQSLGPIAFSSSLSWLWNALYFGGPILIGGAPLVVLYVIVPWIGLMCAGYAFGTVMQMSRDRRQTVCLRLGLAAMAGFVVLRAAAVYGDPFSWKVQAGWLMFLNPAKYPPSLQFLLMTCGPLIFALPFVETVKGGKWGVLTTIGRVPLFFYLLHLPLIHLLAIGVHLVRFGSVSSWLLSNQPMVPPPAPEHIWNLPLLYLVWIIAVFLLFWPCRWMARLKERYPGAWSSYI